MKDWEGAVVRACHGDMDAYRFLIVRFQDMAVGYAYSILGDFPLAEDAAQEAFIRVFLDLEKLQKPRSFPSWFRKVIFTQCNRLVRGKRIQTVPMEGAVEMPSEAM